MIRKSIAALLCMCSSLAVAGPDQIDLVGIIPGVTTKEGVKTVSAKQDGPLVYLEIGGYTLPCLGEFSSNVLEHMGCMTGEKATQASNLEIHQILLTGFTSKFGEPERNITTPVKTRFGVEHQANEVWWVDKKGNAIVLYSIQGRIDQGAILLITQEKLQKQKEELERADKARKF